LDIYSSCLTESALKKQLNVKIRGAANMAVPLFH